MNHPQPVMRAATGHRWPAFLVLLVAVLVVGAAAPERASAAADLVLTVSDSPDPATPGETIAVTASIKNVGDEIAYDVQVGFSTITNGTLARAPGCQTFGPGSNFAACGVGDLAPTQSRPTGITLNIDQGVTEVSLYANATSVNSEGEPVVDPTLADNQVYMRTTVEPRADLKLDMSATTPVTMGNTSTLTATVTNSLPGPARETKLQITVPSELPIASVPPGCTATALKVTCELGTIVGQGTASRAVTLGVPNEGSFILLGSVAWAKADPTPIDAQGQITITGLSPIEPTDPGPPQYPVEKPVLAKPQQVPIGLFTRDVPSGRRCIRTRTLRFRLKRPSGIRLTQADVYIGTRRVKRLTGAALTKSIVLTKLPRGRYTVVVVASLQDGGRLSGRRKLRTCP